jgi:hypothetical protein
MLRSSAVSVLASLAVIATGLAAGAVERDQASDTAAPDQTSIVGDNPVNNTPQVLNGHVGALVQVGDTVYVGGVFARVQEAGSDTVVPKVNLFAYSATTGKIDPDFNPVVKGGGIDDMVVAPDGASMWISGFFEKIDGMRATQRVARITLDTGSVVASFKSPKPDDRVTDLNYANGSLYIGGEFAYLNGFRHVFVAALDPATGADLGTFRFEFGMRFGHAIAAVWAMDVSPDGSKLVVAGNFLFVDGESRPQIALFDLNGGASATLSSWQTDSFKQPCRPTARSFATSPSHLTRATSSRRRVSGSAAGISPAPSATASRGSRRTGPAPASCPLGSSTPAATPPHASP